MTNFPHLSGLVMRKCVTAKDLLSVIEQPANYERRFIGFLCGVNTDEWRD